PPSPLAANWRFPWVKRVKPSRFPPPILPSCAGSSTYVRVSLESQMRRLTLFALSAAALGIGACTTTSGEAPALAAAASGAPLPVEGYDWHFNADRNEAQLAYGVAESDDLK